MGKETWEFEAKEELSYCCGSFAQWGRREATQGKPEAQAIPKQEVTAGWRWHR